MLAMSMRRRKVEPVEAIQKGQPLGRKAVAVVKSREVDQRGCHGRIWCRAGGEPGHRFGQFVQQDLALIQERPLIAMGRVQHLRRDIPAGLGVRHLHLRLLRLRGHMHDLGGFGLSRACKD